MKKIIAFFVACLVLVTCSSVAFADEWRPSQAREEIEVVEKAPVVTTSEGTTVEIEVGVVTSEGQTVVDDEGNAGSVGNVTNLSEITDKAVIRITSIEQTLEAAKVEMVDADKSSSGLPYVSNVEASLVYEAIQKAPTTEKFVQSLGEDVVKEVAKAIENNIAKTKEKLENALEDAKADGDNAKVAELTKKLDNVNDENYSNVANYTPASIFDVSVNDFAKDLIDGGKVEITTKVPGITADSDIIVLHYHADDKDAVMAGGDIADLFAVEVVPHKIDADGLITIEMSTFSPVVILTCEQGADPVVGDSSFVREPWFIAFVIADVIAIAACAFFMLKGKKEAHEA